MDNEAQKTWQQAMTRCCDNWRQCFESALRVVDANVQGAGKVPQTQIAAAKSPVELCLLQANWLAANLQRSYDEWTRLFEAAGDTSNRSFKCMFAQMQAANGDFARLCEEFTQAATAKDDERKKTLAALLDAAYTDWLKTSQKALEAGGVPPGMPLPRPGETA